MKSEQAKSLTKSLTKQLNQFDVTKCAWAASATVALFGLSVGSAFAQACTSPPPFCPASSSAGDTLIDSQKASPASRTLVFSSMGLISQTIVGRLAAPGSARTAGLNVGTGMAAAAQGSPWSTWAAVGYNAVGYNFAPLASSGSVNNALLGIDYGLSNGALVGVVMGIDSTNISTSFNGGSVGVTGYTVTPYFAVPIGSNLTLDGSLGVGSGNVNANIGGGVSGSTDESRSFGSLALTYTMNVEKWQIQGVGSLLSSSTSQRQLTLSNAQTVASTNSGSTQLRVGFRANYGSGDFIPFMGLSVSSDLSSTNTQAVGGQNPANAKTAVYLLAGVSIKPGQKISGSVQLNSEVRNQVRNNGVTGTVSFKF